MGIGVDLESNILSQEKTKSRPSPAESLKRNQNKREKLPPPILLIDVIVLRVHPLVEQFRIEEPLSEL